MYNSIKAFYFLTLLIALNCVNLNSVNAQYFVPSEWIPVERDGVPLTMPWAGGLNNPQYSGVDLNADGVDDLFVFDRSEDQSFAFINVGEPGEAVYEWDRVLSDQFPKMAHWAKVLDYNCDDIPDVFCATSSGFKVYEGNYDADILGFTEINEEVVDNNGALIVIVPTDIPAIVDVEGDGDIDVLTFNPDGGYLFFYENLGTECGELLFEITDSCWGNFYESGISENSAVDLYNPNTDPPQPLPLCGLSGKKSGKNSSGDNSGYLTFDEKADQNRSNIHPGSTVCAMNLNGDGLKELILGDISFDNLVCLYNSDSLDFAIMDSQDVYFPVYDNSVLLKAFPAAFNADVNNDGLEDLLVSPNNKVRTDGYYTSWYFENIGTEEQAYFSIQQKDFLIDQMVEVGEYAHPAFFDYNGDGLLDMVLSNRRSSLFVEDVNDSDVSSLFLYENIGTVSAPVFSLVSNDYLSLSALEFEDLSPTFGDVDGDGAMDLICGVGDAASPEFNGTLVYIGNKSSIGEPAVFGPPVIEYQGIDVKQKSAPQLVDVNEDGLLDLLIGNRNGVVYYYENEGTTTEPNFVLANEYFGEVDVRSEAFLSGSGHARPFLSAFKEGEERYLLVGSETGQIFSYSINQDSLYGGKFPILSNQFNGIDAGTYAAPCLADLDDDGLQDLFIGYRRGGIRSYVYEDFETGVENIVEEQDETFFQVYPNPVNDVLSIDLKQVPYANLVVYNALGQAIHTETIEDGSQINVSNWSNGLYFFTILKPQTNLDSEIGTKLVYKVTVGK